MKKTRISKKMLMTFINNVADKKEWTDGVHKEDAYFSKLDGSYLTFVGLEADLKYLLRLGITYRVRSGLGFNPKEQKWYGWSHRAIYGFGVGSECKKGDCGYKPFDKQDFLEDCVRFWEDEKYHVETTAKEFVDHDGANGVLVSYTYNDKVKNEKLRGSMSSVFTQYPDEFGKGEWTAKTLDDAKQMAIDFADGVG